MATSWRTLLACAGLSACASGTVASTSTPEPLVAAAPGALDGDADGFVGAADGCPAEPGAGPNGCPLRDQDPDGVLDAADKCVDVPGGTADGCPPPDDDGDLVIDARDPCPTLAETVNGYQDRDGCPDEIPKDLVKFQGVIPGIEFGLDNDVLRRRSGVVLRRAAAVLGKYPEVRIEISAHTTADGSREHNLDLTRRRANAVKRDLVTRGVAASRIETRGAGPDEPWGCCNICPPGGRKQNRRVEFTLLIEWPRDESSVAQARMAGSASAPRTLQ